MRSDIPRVVVDRPRVKGWDGRGKPGQRNRNHKPYRRIKLELVDYGEGETLDDVCSLKRGSMARFAKLLSDFLSPLRGWARQQVGRTYDNAMREVHRLLPGNGVQQAHVREHINDFIIPSHLVEIRNGRAFYAPNHYIAREISDINLYVDPRDGVIKWGKGPSTSNERRKALRAPPKDHLLRVLPNKDGIVIPVPDTSWGATNRSYVRERGVWYEQYTILERIPTLSFKPLFKLVERRFKASRESLRNDGFRRPRR